jgi:anti-sigma-K factor RskA
MAQRPEWRDEVEFWSARLATLAETVPPANPPALLWQKIQGRITAQRPEERSRALRWWKALAAVSSIATVVLAIMLVAVPYPPTFGPQVSVLKDEESRTGWILTVAARRTGGAEIRAAADGARPLPGKSFELWALPGAGAAPVSLGLLPSHGEATLPISAQALPLLQRGAALAVSIEPSGGSPTGQPTGPVAYQGKLIPM